MVEVFLVLQTEQNPHREIVVAVGASRQRAEKFITAESAKGGEFHTV
jgi:hypothetical protein